MNSNQQLSGIEKASVLILSLGLKQSAKVFEHLSESEREILSAQIIKIKHVDTVTKQRVLDEVSEIVRTKPVAQPSQVAPVAASPAPASEKRAFDPSVPLKWIEGMEPEDAASMLSTERAHSVALVVSRLAPKCAADILSNLSEKQRNDVVHKLSHIRSVSDEVIEAIDETLRRKAEKESGAERQRYTPSTLLESLNNASEPGSMPKSISSVDDLLSLSDSQVSAVLREVSQTDLCQVLRVAGDELKSAVMRNMPDDARTVVDQEMNTSAQVKLRELEAAQRRIVDAMKRCADATPVMAG